MLLGFRVANFLSFNEVQSFNMISDDIMDHYHIADVDGMGVLKASLIYGPNSSGKSNLLSAMQYAQMFIRYPYLGPTDYLEKYRERPLHNILSDSTTSFFEFIVRCDASTFVFGMYVDVSCNCLVSEYAYDITDGNDVIFEIDYHEAGYDGNQGGFIKRHSVLNNVFNKKTVPESWVKIAEAIDGIHIAMDDEIPVFMDITLDNFEWLKNSLCYLDPNIRGIRFVGDYDRDTPFGDPFLFDPYSRQVDLKAVLKEYSVRLSYDFDGLRIYHKQKSDERFEKCVHNHLKMDYGNYSILFESESAGVKRSLCLLMHLYNLIDKSNLCNFPSVGRVLIMDEIERCFHPLVIERFFSLFYRESPSCCVQLIATTHESRLMESGCVTPDGIWLVDLNQKHETILTQLSAYRTNDSERLDYSYTSGRFGSIPLFGPYERDADD